MKQPRLGLYLVDMKYIRNLSRVDDHVMSVSPQIGKSDRPFVGIIVICDDKQYCVPLSSPKAKHNSMKNDVDFMKIYHDDKLIGVLNFNEMIPVNQEVIFRVDARHNFGDSRETARYKDLLVNQLTFCRKNQEAIVKKANKLYEKIISGKANDFLLRRCCNFKKLEHVLEQYKKRN